MAVGLPDRAGDPVADPDRVARLRRTGLDAVPDPALDRFARMVRKVLDVPVALVSLVDDLHQFFPGAAGLEVRETPLRHSFCQEVVRRAGPLVITDARVDPRVSGNPAVEELHVVAYAGMPLTDAGGAVLGSLCLIDDHPREWTGRELDLLADLAASCSAELRLRIAADRADRAQRQAEAALGQVRTLSAGLADAWRRSQLLLTAIESLTATVTVADVVRVVSGLVSCGLEPVHVSITLVDEHHDRLRVLAGTALPQDTLQRWGTFSTDDDLPSTRAFRTGRPQFFEDRDEIVTRFPHLAPDLAVLGWEALALVPLNGAVARLGTIRFAWSRPRRMDDSERAVVVAVAGYVAQALDRAMYLNDQFTVAETLQRAMLTELPHVPPYELAARYRPARQGGSVGGDWYDAVPLPDGALGLVIGDVMGHDMAAAGQMGQVRSMLRGFLVDRPGPPGELLVRLDTALAALGEDVLLTALLAVVSAGTGGYRLDWVSAGHLPPLLVHADGRVQELPGRGLMLGVRPGTARAPESCGLPAGSTVLLFTDGLVETRQDSVAAGVGRLAAVVGGLAGKPPGELLDAVLAALPAPDHEDDIAVLALRVPGVP